MNHPSTRPVSLTLQPFPPASARTAANLPRLDARLSAAIPYVRGGTIADVGTDHAYLPLTLLLQKRCTFAVASDIHRGPAQRAAEHLQSFGIGPERAAVLCTDGLHGLQSYHPTDIIIFGMGGEMIVHILEEAPWVYDPSVRLILQPMTHPEILRQSLAEHGFAIRSEQLVFTDRIYQIICAEYDGVKRSFTPIEYLIGANNIHRHDPLLPVWIERQLRLIHVTMEGKNSAGIDTSAEQDLIDRLTSLKESYFTTTPNKGTLL